MTEIRGLPDSLHVPKDCLSGEVIARQSAQHGFAQPNSLEALLWDFEIQAQLQVRIGGAVRLKGGAATQLYVSPDRQRASVDADVLTSLPKPDIEAQLSEIEKVLQADGRYFTFEPYVPQKPAKTPGLHSHTVLVPSALGQVWRLQDGTEIEGRMIKVDFHQVPDLPPRHPRPAVVVGLDLRFEVDCVGNAYLIAEKLLTQARKTVGVPDSRFDDLPKHLYDLDGLTSFPALQALLTEAAEWLPEVVAYQGPEWQGPRQLARVLEDLETSLEGFAVVDYAQERGSFTKAVSRLETLYLPASSRWRLHHWATKAARILAFVRVINPTVLHRRPPEADLLSTLEALATKVRTHAEPAELAQMLYAHLPPELRRIRQLKGSPPERLYWLLAGPQNLDWLAGILT
jgi:hypothetical protein